jgi:hypothetical protein
MRPSSLANNLSRVLRGAGSSNAPRFPGGARRRPDGRQLHLLAAMDHANRAVLAQRQVDGAPGEVPAFQPLLDGPDLAFVAGAGHAASGRVTAW